MSKLSNDLRCFETTYRYEDTRLRAADRIESLEATLAAIAKLPPIPYMSMDQPAKSPPDIELVMVRLDKYIEFADRLEALIQGEVK